MTARTLAVWALSLASPGVLRVSLLISQAEVMGIEPMAMRVALARLSRERMAVLVARGSYALGPAATALHAKARHWSETEGDVRPWHGTWIVVLADHLGRTDRRQVQARERALRLTGFAASETGAWVRPDNLVRDAAALADELRGLGLDERAVILDGCGVGKVDEADFRRLWRVDLIESGYRHWLGEMSASAGRVRDLPAAEAARETLLLGQSVIRAINSDPMLPADMIDTCLRASVVAAMRQYDAMARGLWAQIGLMPRSEPAARAAA